MALNYATRNALQTLDRLRNFTDNLAMLVFRLELGAVLHITRIYQINYEKRLFLNCQFGIRINKLICCSTVV